jgi:hypothetical protein
MLWLLFFPMPLRQPHVVNLELVEHPAITIVTAANTCAIGASVAAEIADGQENLARVGDVAALNRRR